MPGLRVEPSGRVKGRGIRGPGVIALLGGLMLMALIATAFASGAFRDPRPTLPPLGPAVVRPLVTPGPGATPVTLVGAGDIASCASEGDEATAALLGEAGGTVFTAGDNVYDDGTLAEFQACYDSSWGRFKAQTLPVVGNHEYNTNWASGHFRYFGEAAGHPREGWYVRDVGAWGVYALNSNCGEIGGCGEDSRQAAWLAADLAANPRRCVLAIWHHSRFSSGEHGSNDSTETLWRILQAAGAEIVVSGHDHGYERFAPQDPAGAPDEAGLVGFVAGTGGRSHYAFEDVQPNSLVRNGDTFGVLRLDLAPDSWTFEFLPVTGSTFTDSGGGRCH
jgi:hypothetical protein